MTLALPPRFHITFNESPQIPPQFSITRPTPARVSPRASFPVLSFMVQLLLKSSHQRPEELPSPVCAH